MKIALIDEFHNERAKSGIGRYTFELLRALNSLESDISLLALAKKGEEQPDEKNVKILEGCSCPILNRTFNWQFYYPRIIPEEYDVYHTTNPFLIRTVAGRENSVVTIHDMGLFELDEHKFPHSLSPYYLFSWLHRSLLIKYINHVSHIIAISEYTKNRLIKILGIHTNKISVIYHGVNDSFRPLDKTECRQTLNIPLDKRVLLYIGTELPKKNVETLMEALRKLIHKRTDVLLIRIGARSARIAKLIKKCRLDNHIRYFNNIGDDMLPLFYNAADIFIFPSVYEGFGLPLLESMACGTPVVAANASCFPEIISDAGLLFHPKNFSELADKIQGLLSNKQLMRELIQKGRERASEFMWRKTALLTREVYRKLYGNNKQIR